MSLIEQRDAVEKIRDESSGGAQKVLADALSKALIKIIEHTNVINTQAQLIERLKARIDALERGPNELV
jgi:hypothetical protein